MTVKIFRGDCREVLRTLPDESVHCVVTSPPYWGLRDYGFEGQIGLETDFGDYVAELVEVFREARRVLRADGTFWLNLGDSYAGSGRGGNPTEETSGLEGGQASQRASMIRRARGASEIAVTAHAPDSGTKFQSRCVRGERRAGALLPTGVDEPAVSAGGGVKRMNRHAAVILARARILSPDITVPAFGRGERAAQIARPIRNEPLGGDPALRTRRSRRPTLAVLFPSPPPRGGRPRQDARGTTMHDASNNGVSTMRASAIDGAAGRLAWADDAERRALAQEVYTRVMGFVRPRIAAHEIPLLTVAIDEALDGVAQTRRIARIDEELRSGAESPPAAAITGGVPRLVDIRASGLPGDCEIVLDFIRMVFVTHGWSVKRIDDGVRPYIEVLLMPEMEAYLREMGLPQVDAA